MVFSWLQPGISPLDVTKSNTLDAVYFLLIIHILKKDFSGLIYVESCVSLVILCLLCLFLFYRSLSLLCGTAGTKDFPEE